MLNLQNPHCMSQSWNLFDLYGSSAQPFESPDDFLFELCEIKTKNKNLKCSNHKILKLTFHHYPVLRLDRAFRFWFVFLDQKSKTHHGFHIWLRKFQDIRPNLIYFGFSSFRNGKDFFSPTTIVQ